MVFMHSAVMQRGEVTPKELEVLFPNRMQPVPLIAVKLPAIEDSEGASGIGRERDECTLLHLSDRLKSTAFKEFEK